MNINYKKWGVGIVVILLLTVCLFIVPALADGTSDGTSATSSFNEKTSVSSISQDTSLPSSSEEMSVVPTVEEVFAGDEYEINLNLLNTSSTKYTVDSANYLIILTESNGTYTVSGSTSSYGIKVAADCTIRLNGASIIPATDGMVPLDLNGHVVTVILEDGSVNTLNGSGTSTLNVAGAPGIRSYGSKLTIKGAATGTGKLNAVGGLYAAGIGGGNGEDGGEIYLIGGTISSSLASVGFTRAPLNGKAGGAGIGGGYQGEGGIIAISGNAKVTATSWDYGAAIGGGALGAGGNISISGNAQVNASVNGIMGAGIGGGYQRAGGTVSISENVWVKTSGEAGIGGGAFGSGGVGTISGGNVLSTSEDITGSSAEMVMYSDNLHTTQIYQNILTVNGLKTSGTISSINISEGVPYDLSEVKTIGLSSTKQVISVWIPASTSPEEILATVDGSVYEKTYLRLASENRQTLSYVNTPVTSISLDKETLTMFLTTSETLIATVHPNNATDQTITWISDDENIATVDSNGVITGKSVGTTTIKVATSDGLHFATCVVTVSPFVYTVTPPTLLFTGGTEELSFKVNEPPVSEFQGLTVEGALLETENYILSSESTIFTLSNTWLTSLPNGTYVLTASFTYGSAEVTLLVNQSNASSDTSSSPSNSSDTSSNNSSSSNSSNPSSGSNSNPLESSSNTLSSTSGNAVIPDANGNGSNNSKEFWYSSSSTSGTSASTETSSSNTNSSTATSANDSGVTSPDSPNYNPVTGGEVGGTGTLIGFSVLALFTSVGIYLGKRKK